MANRFIIEQAYFFKASPKKVFDALTTPEGLTSWFLSDAALEARTGSIYEFDWLGGYHMEGNIKGIQSGKSVSYSWHDKLPNGKNAVTNASFSVAKKGSGTILKLRHTGFEDPVHFAECSSRWGYYLTNMKSVLDHGTDLRSEYDW